jgi:transposase
MLTRQEREQIVLDLYNQGKTIRDIAKEVRMSFRDIGAVLRKEEKERERKQLDNKTTTRDSDNNQRGTSLSVQAYELFSLAKTPVDVAIELNLSERQVTKFYREYWK